jgi:hypothetical protein
MIILLVWMVIATWLSGTRLFQTMVGLVAHVVCKQWLYVALVVHVVRYPGDIAWAIGVALEICD